MQYLKKSLLTGITMILLVAAIAGSEDVIIGAREGLDLCVQVIIPSIFPVLFLSMLMCNYSNGVTIPVLTPLCKLTGIPKHCQQILILSMIGGYPVGAQAVVSAHRDKVINTETARRLLGFCNNAGPAFIFGLLGTVFQNKQALVCLWLIHIGSALIVGMLLPGKSSCNTVPLHAKSQNVTATLKTALQVTSMICGWVILFRILLSLLNRSLQALPITLRVILSGILELSNGCLGLREIQNEYLQFMIASVFLAVGGICVLLQTWSVVDHVGFGAILYGKLLQTILSILFSSLACPILYHVPFRFVTIIISAGSIVGIIALLNKKSSSIIYKNAV